MKPKKIEGSVHNELLGRNQAIDDFNSWLRSDECVEMVKKLIKDKIDEFGGILDNVSTTENCCRETAKSICSKLVEE